MLTARENDTIRFMTSSLHDDEGRGTPAPAAGTGSLAPVLYVVIANGGRQPVEAARQQ
jgi:hypothetical protein